MAGREKEKKVKNEGFHNCNISATNYENLYSTSYNERERERKENGNSKKSRCKEGVRNSKKWWIEERETGKEENGG